MTGHEPRILETSREELLSIRDKKLINILPPSTPGKEILRLAEIDNEMWVRSSHADPDKFEKQCTASTLLELSG